MEDTHYIPNLRNAHIDTTTFEKKVESDIKRCISDDTFQVNILRSIHKDILSIINNDPDEPADEQIICRYLTPLKYLWFVSQKTIRFCSANEFDDPKECTIPNDYDYAVRQVLNKYKIYQRLWDSTVGLEKRKWLVSCWNVKNNNDENNLIWHKYCGGPQGVGITIRYGALKKFILENYSNNDNFKTINTGLIDYGKTLRKVPFNKRSSYQNEQEIRFAFETDYSFEELSINVSEIFQEFRIRLSEDSSYDHEIAVMEIWNKFGGRGDAIRPS